MRFLGLDPEDFKDTVIKIYPRIVIVVFSSFLTTLSLMGFRMPYPTHPSKCIRSQCNH